jgi:hypothetical protein
MKYTSNILAFLSLSFLTFIQIYSQNIPIDNSDVQVEIEQFVYKRNWRFELTNRKEQIKKATYNFSSNGLIEEKIKYGTDFDFNFRHIGSVETFRYDSVWSIIKSEEWETYNRSRVELRWYTLYKYNISNNLISEMTYSAHSDSLFYITTYEYTDTSEIRRNKNSNTYVISYDSIGRRTQLKQLWDNDTKMNWIINYTFTDTTRVQRFDSYFDDDIRDYSRMMIYSYKGDKLALIHEYYIDKDGLNEKKVLEYDSHGYLSNVELWEYSTAYEEYYNVGFISFDISSKKDISNSSIEKINDEIITDFIK